MESIDKTIFEILDARADEIAADVSERDALDVLIRSGRYKQEYIQNDLFPKRSALQQKIRNASDAAINEAKALVNQYRQDTLNRNRLDPAEMTDDVKLLAPGIVLEQRDIIGMLERNAGNRTMTQIILRYAKEHDFETGLHFDDGHAEAEHAKDLEGVISLYAKWIDKPKAKQMLRTFFQVNE